MIGQRRYEYVTVKNQNSYRFNLVSLLDRKSFSCGVLFIKKVYADNAKQLTQNLCSAH